MPFPILLFLGIGAASVAAVAVTAAVTSGGDGGGDDGGSDNVRTGVKHTHDASDNSYGVTQQRFTGDRNNHEHAFSTTKINGNTGEITHHEGVMNTIDGKHTT